MHSLSADVGVHSAIGLVHSEEKRTEHCTCPSDSELGVWLVQIVLYLHIIDYRPDN